MNLFKLIYIVYLQHKLQLRWNVCNFVNLVPKRLRWLNHIFWWFPFFVFCVVYAITLHLLTDPKLSEFINQLTFTKIYSLSLIILGVYLFTNNYKSHFLRSFFPKDISLYLHQKNHFLFFVAKLVGSYFLNLYLLIFPAIIAFILALKYGMTTSHTTINLVEFILNLTLYIFCILIFRMLTMTLLYFFFYSNRMRFSLTTTYTRISFLLKLGFLFLVSNRLTLLYLEYRQSNLNINEMFDFDIVVFFLPNGWIMFNLIILGLIFLLGGYMLVRKYIFKANNQNEVGNYRSSTYIDLTKISTKFENWGLIFFLSIKDFVILLRDRQSLFIKIKSFISILFVLLGLLYAFKNIYIPNYNYLLFAVVTSAQIMLSFSLKPLISRVTSIDSEGSLINIYLAKMIRVRDFILSKLLCHFVITICFVLILTLLLNILFFRFDFIYWVLGIYNALMLSISTTGSYVLSTAMFPMFNWDHESQIGNSSKSSLMDTILSGFYIWWSISASSILGVLVYMKKLNELQFIELTVINITFINCIYIILFIFLLRRFSWDRWKNQ